MVAEPYTAVDVESAVRQWTRDQGFVAFFGVNNNGTFPQITLQRIAGPDDDCLIQWDVWGGTKAEAATTEASLRTALTGMSVYVHDGVRLHGASDPTSRWLPDPDSDRPRYIVEASITATAA